MTHEEHWDFERSGQMNLLFRPFRGAAPFRGRLHGRVVPAKRVDSLCRVDPLSIVIPYYFNITITW